MRMVVWLLPVLAFAQAGKDWGVERETYRDPVTGVEIVEISKTAASNLYFHFSNFSADNRRIVFSSDRNGAQQICSFDVESGRVTQLTEGAGVAASTACPHPAEARRLFFMRSGALVEMDLAAMKERVIGSQPGLQGQPTLSHDGKSLAMARRLDAANWEVGLMDIASGAWRGVIRTGFQIGHVQHHPKEPVIFYVWETGGYAPQRTWVVNSDGTRNRPFYFRTDPKEWFTPLKEWITHEAWVPQTGEMTMIVDNIGVLFVSLDGKARLIPGDYWHVAARPDGKVLVLDDNAGRVWIMDAATGSTRLLATGIRDSLRATHGHASFDRRGRYVLFNNSHRRQTVSIIDLETLPAQKWSR